MKKKVNKDMVSFQTQIAIKNKNFHILIGMEKQNNRKCNGS